MTPRLLILIAARAPIAFGQALTITTPNALPVATINQAYSAQLTAMGGESSLLLAFSSRGESFDALYGFRFGAPEWDAAWVGSRACWIGLGSGGAGPACGGDASPAKGGSKLRRKRRASRAGSPSVDWPLALSSKPR